MALYPNGRAPASALVSIYGCVASPDMARRVKYVKEEYDRTHSDNLIINEIYRTYDEQVRQRQRWTALGQPNNAAVPGFSNHGDWDIGAVDWNCDDIGARRTIAARVGLIHNISNESWHAAKIGTTTVALPELGGNNAATPIEEDVLNDADRQWIVGQIRSTGSEAVVLGWDQTGNAQGPIAVFGADYHENSSDPQRAGRPGRYVFDSIEEYKITKSVCDTIIAKGGVAPRFPELANVVFVDLVGWKQINKLYQTPVGEDGK